MMIIMHAACQNVTVLPRQQVECSKWSAKDLVAYPPAPKLGTLYFPRTSSIIEQSSSLHNHTWLFFLMNGLRNIFIIISVHLQTLRHGMIKIRCPSMHSASDWVHTLWTTAPVGSGNVLKHPSSKLLLNSIMTVHHGPTTAFHHRKDRFVYYI